MLFAILPTFSIIFLPNFSSSLTKCPNDKLSIAVSTIPADAAKIIALPSDIPLSNASFKVDTYALDPINVALNTTLAVPPVAIFNNISEPVSAILIPVL